MALIEEQASGREEEKGGEGIIKIPGISPYEGWLLEYRSPKHRMSAPPSVQHLTSADIAHVKKHNYISEYRETLERTKVPIDRMLSSAWGTSSSCKWMDIIFNYSVNEELPHARMFEVAIGNCRITTRKRINTSTDLEWAEKVSVGKDYGRMRSYARVGIPAAAVEAIKLHVRRATCLVDVDVPGYEEVSNGLRWMRVGFSREGVYFIRVTGVHQSAQTYYRASNLTALETERSELPCVLFLMVRVSRVRLSGIAPPIQMIHFLLVECHHMDGPMFT